MTGMEACNSRAALTAGARVSLVAGDRRRQGESRMDHCPRTSKSMLEPSVWKDAPPRAGLQPEPGRQLNATGCVLRGRAAPQPRTGLRPALSGAKSIAYRVTGCVNEHGNLDPSAAPTRVRQAARSGVVSDGGRSLRSSRSAGE